MNPSYSYNVFPVILGFVACSKLSDILLCFRSFCIWLNQIYLVGVCVGHYL